MRDSQNCVLNDTDTMQRRQTFVYVISAACAILSTISTEHVENNRQNVGPVLARIEHAWTRNINTSSKSAFSHRNHNQDTFNSQKTSSVPELLSELFQFHFSGYDDHPEEIKQYPLEKRSAVSTMSSLGNCQRRLARMTLSPPGCFPKTIVVLGCHGSCHSRSVPEWSFEKQEVEMIDYCTCCEPRETVTRRVTLRCSYSPTGRRYARIRLPVNCECRPCSDGDPQAEQPYDY